MCSSLLMSHVSCHMSLLILQTPHLRRKRDVRRIVLKLSKYCIGVLPRSSGKYWQYIGRLTASRLTKSGIECVILAWSSLFASSRAESWLWSGLVSFWRDFSRISTFWHLKSQKFRSPAGAWLSQLGSGSLSIGRILQMVWLSKYWRNICHTTQIHQDDIRR